MSFFTCQVFFKDTSSLIHAWLKIFISPQAVLAVWHEVKTNAGKHTPNRLFVDYSTVTLNCINHASCLNMPALFFLFETSKQRQAGSVQQWLWHRGRFSSTFYFICTQGVWHLNCSDVRKLDRVNSIPAAEYISTFYTTVSLRHPWPIRHGKVTLTHLHCCKNKTKSGKLIE